MPYQIEPLHWRTFILRRLWTLCTFVLIFLILFVRHRGLSEILWGDDQLFVYRALNISHPPHLRFHPRTSWPSMAWSHFEQFQKFDTLRLAEPFNNQILVIPRVITKLLTAISISDFVRNATVFSLFWLSGLLTFLSITIERLTNRTAGSIAAICVAVMPFSNRVMLGQVNPLVWPAVMVLFVVVVANQYPISKLGRASLSVFIALISVSTLLFSLLLIYLILSLIFSASRRNPMNLLTALLMSAGQAFEFVVAPRRVASRNHIDIPFQLLNSAYGFVPQAIRNNIFGPVSSADLLVLVSYPVFITIAASLLIVFGLRGERRSQIFVALRFTGAGFATLVLLIFANGALNSHYLFLPTALFWVSCVMFADAALRSRKKFSVHVVLALVVLFLGQLSGTYFLI